GVSLSAADQADEGELFHNMAVSAHARIKVTIVSTDTALSDTLGAFTIDHNGRLHAVKILDPDVTAIDAGRVIDYSAGGNPKEIGFFVIANGAGINNNYAGLDFSTGKLNFIYDYGKADQHTAK